VVPAGEALTVDIANRVAVVTGGASGIGRALCLAFADRGAAGVVVADIDGHGAASVAEEAGSRGTKAISVQADMSGEADVQMLVGRAEQAFGRIDVFCSNAGIIVPGGVEVPDEAWSRIWAINVQSHVYVARAVLPGMLARGGGHLVITASAAGLLTQLGSAPYAVTKHAAVALAEWLAITYGDQGIGVSCLCPQAVTTNLGETSQREMARRGDAWTEERGMSDEGRRHLKAPRPSEGYGGSSPRADTVSLQASVDGVLTADQVAVSVIDALAAGRFLILPHPEVAAYERRRAEDRDRWLGGMRRLQARLAGKG
jgi:NAD(P)-dependent dehydrogenase (short-subunit alcohol dehydrogenase family)